MHTYMLIAWKN